MTRYSWILLLLGSLLGCEQRDFSHAEGTPGRYQEWLGSWVVVNYWAEWCAPCRYEIPELNELASGSGGEPGAEEPAQGLKVIGVNYDGITGEELIQLIERMGIEFPVVLTDPQPRFGYDRPSVLPTTVLIGPDGEVREVLVGPQTRDALERRMLAPQM